MRKKIAISVTNNLEGDNRVHKVANSLQSIGYDIVLIGRKYKSTGRLNRKYNLKRFSLIFNKSFLFYAEYNIRLFFYLIFSKCDIFLANDLDTLVANYFAAKLTKKKLVYDSHELFTEVPELVNRKFVQKIWLLIEASILPKIKFSYTVCQSIAFFYRKKYGIKMRVVRNVPVCINSSQPNIYNIKKRKILLYQGAVNLGRGLEEMIDAMQYLEDFELWIIGRGDIIELLRANCHKLNLCDKVFFLGFIDIDKLYQYTQKADLGLSIEKKMGLNYFYALPNKIFDYIQADVPVLCSDFPEMSKIVKKYNIGEVLNSHEPHKIAEQIKNIFKNSDKIQEWKKNLKHAKKEFCWQNEEKIIFDIFDKIQK